MDKEKTIWCLNVVVEHYLSTHKNTGALSDVPNEEMNKTIERVVSIIRDK